MCYNLQFVFIIRNMTTETRTAVTRTYMLVCPRCDMDLHGMWFAFSNEIDDHGYLCCSGCVTDVVKLSGIPRLCWISLTSKECRMHPNIDWVASLKRTTELLNLGRA